MKLEKIEKINNITNSDLEKYKKNTLIRRSKDVKGIGSWNSEDLKYIVDKDGLDKMIQVIDFEGETGQELIDEWLGDDSSPRKKYILDNDFKIAMV